MDPVASEMQCIFYMRCIFSELVHAEISDVPKAATLSTFTFYKN